MAARLGFWDVDELVRVVPKKKLDKWMAVAEIAGWDDEWSMASNCCVRIHNTLTQFMARLGLKPKDDELLKFDHMEPDWRTGRERVETDPLTLDQQAQQWKNAIGV